MPGTPSNRWPRCWPRAADGAGTGGALTQWITAVSGRFKHAVGLSALALIAFLVLALSTREWTPIADETQYLNAAYNLVHHGVLSPSVAGPPLTPSARREPGYPVFIATVMLLDPGLGKFTPACNAPPDPKCAPYDRSLQ